MRHQLGNKHMESNEYERATAFLKAEHELNWVTALVIF